MKKLYIWASLLVIVMLCIAVPIVTALTSYNYYTTVSINNSTAAAITDRYIFSVNSSALVNNGFMQSDADDVRLDPETDIDANYSTLGELTNTSAYWYTDRITIPAYGTANYNLWSGNTSATARDQTWVGDESDVNSVPDAASLDVTTNLTVKADVYLDSLPAAETEIISKQGAYELVVDNTNFIFRVWQAGVPTTVDISPNGNGAYSNLFNTAANHTNNYTYVNEAPPLGVGADGTFVYWSTATPTYDTYELADPSIPEGSAITSVSVYYRAYNDGGATGTAIPILYLNNTLSTGTPQSTTGAFSNYTSVVSRPGGGTWVTSDLASLQGGIELYYNTACNVFCSQLYIQVSYTPPDAGHVSQIAATTDAWKTVTCTYDGANTAITDGTLNDSDALAGALFTNGEPLDLLEVNGKFDDAKIGDTNIGAPTWKFNLDFEADQITGTGATVSVNDQSASNNDMSSTRAGNPAGITVTLSGIVPSIGGVPVVGESALSVDAAKEWNPQDIVNTEEGSTLTHDQVPEYLVSVMSETSGVETQWVWWFTYGILCICLFLVGLRFLHGHITISWLLVIIATALFVAWGPVPWWFVLIDCIFMLGSLAWENRQTV